MRRIGALGGIVAAMLFMSPPAAAEPAGDGSVAVAPTLSLRALGASPTLAFPISHNYPDANFQFPGERPGVTLSFPVPWGLSPVAFRAKLELPLNIRAANLSVSQNDRTLARMSLPLKDGADVVIPLDGMEVSGGWASVGLSMDALPLDNACWDDTATVRMVDGAVTFLGNEAPPGNIADFLPPVLNRVVIAVPAKPSLAESSAAVQVAAAVAKRNGQEPDITIVPLPAGQVLPGAPSQPMERQIVVKEGREKGLSLQGGRGAVPSLLISGTGDELAQQARLLTDDALRLAVSAKTVAGSLPGPDLISDKTTVAELTQSVLLAEATWPRVSIPLDQTRFGHPLRDIQVHLVGSYTPIPADFGAELTASVGAEVIDRWPATADGVIDRMVTIPDRVMKRFAALEVGLRSTGNLGECSDYLPATLRIDGATAIQVMGANPPVPQGFQSFPQALMPDVQFGIGADTFADTVRAVKIAVGLQKISSTPLMTEVTGLDQVIASGRSAVLVSPGGWTDSALQLPFTADDGKLTVKGLDVKGEPTTLTVDAGAKFGSVQTLFEGGRSLLIFTSNGDPKLVDGLLEWLAKPGRWSGLDGRALISVPNSEPVTVPNPVITATQAESSAKKGPDLFWLVAGGIAAVALVGAGLILRRAHRAGAGSR